MASNESEGNCFTFVWKLENISYSSQKKRRRIESLPFVVDAIEKTKWKLWLYPKGERNENYIGYFLHRESDSKGADKIEIKYELAFIAEGGSVLASKGKVKVCFAKGGDSGYCDFESREDVFISKRSTFLPQDTLRVRCRIWKVAGQMAEGVQCTAYTRIGVEKRSFLWRVKNFSTLESKKNLNYQLKSIDNETTLMSIDLFLTEDIDYVEKKDIGIELSLRDQTIKFASLSLFLIDVSGKKVECNQKELWFHHLCPSKRLTFSFTKENLLDGKITYLPKDTLSLLWEWSFSKGVVLETIEDGYLCPEIAISPTHNMNNDKPNPLQFLIDNVKSFYDEHFLSDVKLKTKTNVFPAHKLILSAVSSVFKAMFSNDMKEKDSGFVCIEDLSDDAVSRMLVYIYTTRVEELTWESASELYVAADKYDISSLKNLCSSYMKDNLSLSNACEILMLSEIHSDDELKSFVQNYILKHGKLITSTNEWKAFVENNPKLAVETLCLIFK